MSARSSRPFSFYLALPLLVFTFVQCDVLRDLTTEPTGSTSRQSTARTGTNVSSKEMLLRTDIVNYAKEQLGTRYKYAGRSPRQGFDCSGFTHYVMDNFDIDLSTSSRAQENQGRKISVNDARTGDLIFFRRSSRGSVFHVALVVSNDRDGLKVIHSTSRGVVIDNISQSSYWKPKISTARDVVSN